MKQQNWKSWGIRLAALLLVIGLSYFIYRIRDRAEEYAAYGYPGIFLIALMSNATVLLPAPGLAVVFTMGSIFHPWAVALAAASGGTLGELSGYLAGFSGQAVIENVALYRRIQPWVQRYGGWAILVLAAIPNPFFDVVGIAAGILRMPIQNFLLFCWFGQLIKMSLFAYAGAFSLPWVFGQ
ncbi:MAG: VTT domain-containing protein [Anaerolineales bacterium]